MTSTGNRPTHMGLLVTWLRMWQSQNLKCSVTKSVISTACRLGQGTLTHPSWQIIPKEEKLHNSAFQNWFWNHTISDHFSRTQYYKSRLDHNLAVDWSLFLIRICRSSDQISAGGWLSWDYSWFCLTRPRKCETVSKISTQSPPFTPLPIHCSLTVQSLDVIKHNQDYWKCN